jgi:hypothetical protein
MEVESTVSRREAVVRMPRHLSSAAAPVYPGGFVVHSWRCSSVRVGCFNSSREHKLRAILNTEHEVILSLLARHTSLVKRVYNGRPPVALLGAKLLEVLFLLAQPLTVNAPTVGRPRAILPEYVA